MPRRGANEDGIDRDQVAAEARAGLTSRQLAERFGISETTARRIAIDAELEDDEPGRAARAILEAFTMVVGPAPCDVCQSRLRCGQLRLACEAFASFANGRPESQWRLAPQMPTGRRYLVLFPLDAVETLQAA